MTKKTCPNCQKKIDEFLVYCEFCGQILQKEKTEKIKSTSLVKTNVVTKKIPATDQEDEKISIEVKEQKPEKFKWYTPPKRKRPGYHPLEWFFWIGWGLYVFFRFLGQETLRYFKWCCCWGRPDDLD